jgi:transcriptional regulator with XRE-family HTH domain
MRNRRTDLRTRPNDTCERGEVTNPSRTPFGTCASCYSHPQASSGGITGRRRGEARVGPIATSEPGTFGELLRWHRLAAGLTQEELAEQAGLSARGIADLERGARTRPYPATLQRLVQALGLPEAAVAALHRARRASVSASEVFASPPALAPALVLLHRRGL